MGKRFESWAPPARVWGPWIEIATQVGGPIEYKVDFETISNIPSSFDAEIKYWRNDDLISDIVVGPGSHTFSAGICACVPRIRFRSHTFGQMIKVRVN